MQLSLILLPGRQRLNAVVLRNLNIEKEKGGWFLCLFLLVLSFMTAMKIRNTRHFNKRELLQSRPFIQYTTQTRKENFQSKDNNSNIFILSFTLQRIRERKFSELLQQCNSPNSMILPCFSNRCYFCFRISSFECFNYGHFWDFHNNEPKWYIFYKSN